MNFDSEITIKALNEFVWRKIQPMVVHAKFKRSFAWIKAAAKF